MKITDVTGVGSGAVFLLEGESNILFEAGMAYAADLMIENIKAVLKGKKVDAVLLSHSHYDHVAGLPAVRAAWPKAKVYASERAKEVLVKPAALATIRRLSREAAEAAGMEWDEDYKDEALQVDVVLRDNEKIEIGDHVVQAFETIGHTKCSLSFIVDNQVMLCSETVGVIDTKKQYMPCFLVDYIETELAIEKSRLMAKQIPVEQIILNHYGLVSDEDRPYIWDFLLSKARESKKVMTEVMNTYAEEAQCLGVMEEIFHKNVDKKEQPDEAFDINAMSMMKTLRRQFPEEFLQKGAGICS